MNFFLVRQLIPWHALHWVHIHNRSLRQKLTQEIFKKKNIFLKAGKHLDKWKLILGEQKKS